MCDSLALQQLIISHKHPTDTYRKGDYTVIANMSCCLDHSTQNVLFFVKTSLLLL